MKQFLFIQKVIQKATPFFMIWVSLVLMYAVICSYTNELGQDEFYRVIFFLRSPLVIVINVLAFVFALLHTATYFYHIVSIVKGISQLSSVLLLVFLYIIIALISTGLLMLVLK